MKKILLAIDGNHPTTSAFKYAVDLCKRIKAELRILQFSRKKRIEENLSSPPSSITTLLPKSQKAGVPCKIALSANKPENALVDYIDHHQEIVLTIYDPTTGRECPPPPSRRSLKRIEKRLAVPLVIVKS